MEKRYDRTCPLSSGARHFVLECILFLIFLAISYLTLDECLQVRGTITAVVLCSGTFSWSRVEGLPRSRMPISRSMRQNLVATRCNVCSGCWHSTVEIIYSILNTNGISPRADRGFHMKGRIFEMSQMQRLACLTLKRMNLWGLGLINGYIMLSTYKTEVV